MLVIEVCDAWRGLWDVFDACSVLGLSGVKFVGGGGVEDNGGNQSGPPLWNTDVLVNQE